MSPHHGAQNRSGDVKRRGSFHSCSKDAVWTLTILDYSGFPKSHISIYLDNIYSSQRLFGPRFGHISRCMNTIQCTYSTALQWLFGLQV
ncbi:hypothetical protein TNIN_102281 [Trichonephila inaurata madagascariensis]|uniref:Uncharacterized protein n=1 Tax=Trichonephila inaurata madagascariensis TaxID=2747483 RepID=A0A8X6X284_9ARAC|nr:hypothetical protein TNIN_102281 [Trichonephila inaurata madagascariensis]